MKRKKRTSKLDKALANRVYEPDNLARDYNLPRSRQEILRWVRIYFNTESTVNSIVSENARKSVPEFKIVCPDRKLRKFYNDVAFNDHFNLRSFVENMSLSYHKFGEAIPFGNLQLGDDGLMRWFNFILLEPELVEIKSDMLSGDRTFEMIPTEEIKEMVHNGASNLPTEIVAAIKEHRNIRLDGDVVSLVARLTDPSATRGTSPIQCLFKDLAYLDHLRSSKKLSDEAGKLSQKRIANAIKLKGDIYFRHYRDIFGKWMIQHFFKPLAKHNAFKTLPTIKWEK